MAIPCRPECALECTLACHAAPASLNSRTNSSAQPYPPRPRSTARCGTLIHRRFDPKHENAARLVCCLYGVAKARPVGDQLEPGAMSRAAAEMSGRNPRGGATRSALNPASMARGSDGADTQQIAADASVFIVRESASSSPLQSLVACVRGIACRHVQPALPIGCARAREGASPHRARACSLLVVFALHPTRTVLDAS